MNVALHYWYYREHAKHCIGKTVYKLGTFTATKPPLHASGEVIVNWGRKKKPIQLHKAQMDLLNEWSLFQTTAIGSVPKGIKRPAAEGSRPLISVHSYAPTSQYTVMDWLM